MYSLSKGVISKYIRGECKRRLRLDLYEGKAARVADEAVEKDAKRPGLTLLSEQGRSFERQCFRELDGIFGHQVIRGDFAEYQEGEERALTEISLLAALSGAAPGSFLLEAEYEVCDEFIAAHRLFNLHKGRRS